LIGRLEFTKISSMDCKWQDEKLDMLLG